MEDGRVERAVAASTSLAVSVGLRVDDAVVLQNSNTLALRLLPCDVFARTRPVEQGIAERGIAELEIHLATSLAAAGAPVARLDPRTEPRVHERDGFAVTFWSYYRPTTDPPSSDDYVRALRSLHHAMRSVDIETPHVSDRVAEAEHLLTHRRLTPALAEDDRSLLLHALHEAMQAVRRSASTDQLLHGEPHPGNLLSTPEGILFIDFETGCRGPVEFDVAHVPTEVGASYPGLDRALLEECRRLVLAMVAAWRWDASDSFPDGRRHAIEITRLLRNGPPWPTLDALEGA